MIFFSNNRLYDADFEFLICDTEEHQLQAFASLRSHKICIYMFHMFKARHGPSKYIFKWLTKTIDWTQKNPSICLQAHGFK